MSDFLSHTLSLVCRSAERVKLDWTGLNWIEPIIINTGVTRALIRITC